MKNKKKSEKKQPTVEEFLEFVPVRKDLQWKTNDEGLVEIKVPKFKNKLGISFLKLIGKKNIFSAKMDKIGTIVWKNIDGEKNVEEILEILKKEFSKQENIDQRLFLFLHRMASLGYIDILRKE